MCDEIQHKSAVSEWKKINKIATSALWAGVIYQEALFHSCTQEKNTNKKLFAHHYLIKVRYLHSEKYRSSYLNTI